MRRLTTASVVLAALVAMVPATARAVTNDPVGTVCNASFLPSDSETEQSMEVDGGPLVLSDSDPAANPVSGSLICTLQVGALGRTHAGPDTAVVSSDVTPGVVAVSPTVVPVEMAPFDDIHLCTQVHLASGADLYWNASQITGPGWTTDPNVICAGFVCPGDGCECDETTCPDPLATLIDAIVCPVFQLLAPGLPGVLDIRSDGDVYIAGIFFWDCPPYETGAGQ